jgi:hypothetical protein
MSTCSTVSSGNHHVSWWRTKRSTRNEPWERERERKFPQAGYIHLLDVVINPSGRLREGVVATSSSVLAGLFPSLIFIIWRYNAATLLFLHQPFGIGNDRRYRCESMHSEASRHT